jgi:pyrophosphatase PpaX
LTPSTILFDLDGTLVDSIELIVTAAMQAFASRPGPSPTEAEIRNTIGRPLPTTFGPWLVNDEDLPYLITKYRAYQLEHHDRMTNAYDGIVDAVAKLHEAGCTMAVVTSKVGYLADRALVHCGLSQYMRCVIGADATTKHKPEPEPVLLALDQLSVSCESAVYVGDSPYDMQAARAANVRALGVAWGAFERQSLYDAGAEAVVENPAELLSYLGHPQNV